MLVSIIILSYNTKELLKECLDSVLKHLPKDLYEIIVVDNGSVDGSAQIVKKDFHNVQLIVSEKNLGFAKGVNLGSKKAKGKYLLFLNSDATFHDASLEQLIAFMQNNDAIGVTGGMLLDRDGSEQRSYGKFYDLFTASTMLLFGDRAEQVKKSTKAKAVDWVSGGYMVIRRELFERLKGFDEHFFMYMEDVELCYRVKKLGYVVSIFPKATVVHVNQGSSNRSFAIQQIYKGLLYYYKKHKQPWEYAVLKLLLTVKAGTLLFLGTITHNTYLKTTYREALRFT